MIWLWLWWLQHDQCLHRCQGVQAGVSWPRSTLLITVHSSSVNNTHQSTLLQSLSSWSQSPTSWSSSRPVTVSLNTSALITVILSLSSVDTDHSLCLVHQVKSKKVVCFKDHLSSLPHLWEPVLQWSGWKCVDSRSRDCCCLRPEEGMFPVFPYVWTIFPWLFLGGNPSNMTSYQGEPACFHIKYSPSIPAS